MTGYVNFIVSFASEGPVICLCALWHPWKRCTMGFMTHPASPGKDCKTALRQWKSVCHTERRSFGEEREWHGKKDQDRQDAKHTACTKSKDSKICILCKVLFGYCIFNLLLSRKPMKFLVWQSATLSLKYNHFELTLHVLSCPSSHFIFSLSIAHLLTRNECH